MPDIGIGQQHILRTRQAVSLPGMDDSGTGETTGGRSLLKRPDFADPAGRERSAGQDDQPVRGAQPLTGLAGDLAAGVVRAIINEHNRQLTGVVLLQQGRQGVG